MLLGAIVLPDHLEGKSRMLEPDDPPDFDQKYVEGIQEKLKETALPLFDRIHSIDDVIHLAEEEVALAREKRRYFNFAKLAFLYVYKGWENKTIKTYDKHIETIFPPSRLAEERKKKYIQYLNQKRGK